MTRGRLALQSKKPARAAIIEAAVEQFARRGYDRTSLENIAAALNVTKGTIYYHFSKKTDILLVIHEAFIDVLLERVASRKVRDLAPAAELWHVFHDILWLMENMQGYVRVFFEEWRALDEDQFVHVQTKRDSYEDHVAEVYARGVAEGSFRDLAARMPIFALFGMANWSYQWYRHQGELPAESIADALADIYFSGVLVPGSQARSA